MQARYYDPVVGRFMGIDPIGPRLSEQVTFDRYAYGGNNPYKYVDPDGKAFGSPGAPDDGTRSDSSQHDSMKGAMTDKAVRENPHRGRAFRGQVNDIGNIADAVTAGSLSAVSVNPRVGPALAVPAAIAEVVSVSADLLGAALDGELDQAALDAIVDKTIDNAKELAVKMAANKLGLGKLHGDQINAATSLPGALKGIADVAVESSVERAD